LERLVPIVDQLEEAKAFILRADLSRLRLALLLLDNASEVLMYRAVTEELTWHDYKSRIFSRARDVMSAEELEAFRTEMGYSPLSSKERKTLLQNYNAKVDFLSALKKEGQIPVPLGGVLKAFHRYRNEAYHRDRVRKETIRPVVMVFFDIVADLILVLKPGSMSYSSIDDWAEFYERYGFEYPHQVLDGLTKIVDALKKDMCPDIGAIAGDLSDHIESRVDEVEDALNFLSKDSGAGFSIEEELRRVQFWAEFDCVPHNRDEERFRTYAPPITLETFAEWRRQGNQLRDEADKLRLFLRFAQIEASIEPIEERIHEAAGLLDEAIQFEIDRARGK
jgi:hypothetical protein